MADFEAPAQVLEKPALKLSSPGKGQQPVNETPPPPQYLLDTLNETVCETIVRDLKTIGTRIYQVVWVFNKASNPEVYEQWDIFGPMFLSLTCAILYYFTYAANQPGVEYIIAIVVLIQFLLSFMVAVNMICLGAQANILGTISLIGYASAPMILGAIATLVIVLTGMTGWIRTIIVIAIEAFVGFWSLFVTVGFFKNIAPKGKLFLGVYPVILYFVVLAMLEIVAVVK